MLKVQKKDLPKVPELPYTPFGDRVVIKRIESESISAGGIFIPDTAKEKAQRGWVMAIGSEVDGINVGDLVNFGKYAGTEEYFDGVEYMIMRRSDFHGALWYVVIEDEVAGNTGRDGYKRN